MAKHKTERKVGREGHLTGRKDAIHHAVKGSGHTQHKKDTSPITWLGISVKKSNRVIKTEFDVIELGHSGLPKIAAYELADNLGISIQTMAVDILNVSESDLEGNDKLDKKTSSHVLEVAKVLDHAHDVFEDEEKVKRWINKENKALMGKRPVQLFDTLSGINMVNDILGRIEEGVYS